MRERTYIVDLNKKTYEVAKYKQFDNDIKYSIKVVENGKDVDIASYKVKAFFERSDGFELQKDTVVSKNIVETKLDNNILALAGDVKIEFVFYKNEQRVTTFEMKLFVEKSIDTNKAIVKQPQWDIVKEVLKINNGQIQKYLDSIGKEVNDRFAELTSKQQQDSEVIEARKGKKSLRNKIDEIDSNINILSNDASLFGAKGDGVTDDTLAIQNLLNRKGTVCINKPGVYIVGKLIIDSDTNLILGKNVKLKLKDNTNDYMIVNSGELQTPKVRNKNISIIGGEFDFNRETNSKVGVYSEGGFPGHGVFLHGVDNITIKDIVNAGNARKYAFLIGDADNVIIENSNIENTSDAWHFAPPISNMQLRNLTGYAEDNYIGLIMGDYIQYLLGDEGGFKNIVIENVNLNKDHVTLNAVRLTGSGNNNKYWFENIKINNVQASTGRYSIIDIPYSDLYAESNGTLNKTFIRNIEISNIKPNAKLINTDNTAYIYASAVIHSLLIEGIDYNVELCDKLVLLQGRTQDVILKRIRVDNPNETDYSGSIVKIGSGGIGGSQRLSLEDSQIILNSSSSYNIIESVNSSVDVINLSNNIIDNNNATIVKINSTTLEALNRVLVNNNTFRRINTLLDTTAKVNLQLTSNHFDTPNVNIANLNNIAKLKIDSSGNNCKFAHFNNIESSATLNIKGVDIGYMGLLSQLSAVDSDLVRVQNGNEKRGKGIYLCLDGIWKKIFLSEGEITDNLLPRNDVDCGTLSNLFRNGYFKGFVKIGADSTSERPSVGLKPGASFFDTTLNKPIWWDGINWVDANGSQV